MKFLAPLLVLFSVLTPMNPAAAIEEKVESMDLNLNVGAMQRHVILYTPSGLAPHAPLLIAYHPSGSSAAKMRTMSNAILERLARERGFAIAYPDGFEGHFNDCRRMASFSARTRNIDDMGLTRAIIAEAGRRIASDASRVYALGYSNGGHMAMRVSLEAPELIAGAVVIAANPAVEDNLVCHIAEGRKPSMVFIAGTADPINPYQGGDVNLYGTADRGSVMSAVAGAQWYAKRYGIEEYSAVPPDLEVRGLIAHWRDWGEGQPVIRLITLTGGGHTIPQAKFDFPASLMLGATFRSDVPLESAVDAVGLAK